MVFSPYLIHLRISKFSTIINLIIRRKLFSVLLFYHTVKQLVGMACSLFLITTWLWPLAFPRSKSSVCSFRISSALTFCEDVSWSPKTIEPQRLKVKSVFGELEGSTLMWDVVIIIITLIIFIFSSAWSRVHNECAYNWY